MNMSIAHPSMSQDALKRRWQQRCEQGNFSSTVLGIGTIRVFGKSGDTPVASTDRSLAVLDTLEADERWALDIAQEIVTAAQAKRRPVMVTQPPKVGVSPSPRASA